MPLTLILMRHAKSAWSDPGLDDFDRTLNGRGRTSAVAIGDWLVRRGHLPDSVVVSGARRTVETWSRMAKAMPKTATMRSDPALYLASAETILAVLRAQTDRSVMLIGHNPGIGEFASRIVAAVPDHPRYRDYPTAATTVMTFDADSWREIGWGEGHVVDFVVPRELAD